ncbi:hypothetical protein GIB67_035721, partial [Kingdonia uniflora]
MSGSSEYTKICRWLQYIMIKTRVTKSCNFGDTLSLQVLRLHKKQIKHRVRIVVKWQAPSPGWFKLNTGGSSPSSGLSGAGSIIRDSHGEMKLGYSVALGTGTNMAAELYGLLHGLLLCKENHWFPLVVEMNAEVIVNWYKKLVSQKVSSNMEYGFTIEPEAADHHGSYIQRGSQSRADLLALGLAVTNVLTGLVWLSIRPKSISMVNPEGTDCQKLHPNLSGRVVSELLWLWESLSAVTCCRSLVVVYESRCLIQIGVAAENFIGEDDAIVVDAAKLMQGSLYQGLLKSGAQSYLANLSLYPGRSELPFLPGNTQAVILQPLGERGIAIIGGDTVRGFTTADQAWITLISEKFEATLSRQSTTNQVIESSKNNHIYVVGIYGMGGIGKTTLLNELCKKIEETKLFDEVVMATVGDLKGIQTEIANKLGMRFKEESVTARAARLLARFKQAKDNDLWKELELADVGIPYGCDHQGCKVIFTTRSLDVCSRMESQSSIEVLVLPGKDSWELFKQKAGNVVNVVALRILSKVVAKECKFLSLQFLEVVSVEDIDKVEISGEKFDNTSYISLKKVLGGRSRRAVERIEEDLVGDQERLLREQKSDSWREALIALISQQFRKLLKKRQFEKQGQNVNYKSRPHDRVKSYGKQTNSSTRPHNDSDQDLNKVECYRCHKYGHYAHNCPTKNSNSNYKAMNIKVTWDDDNDEFDDHSQEYENDNYCAFSSIINSSNNYSDPFELENFIEGQSDYKSDNSEEPKIEELYSQLISQLEKLKKKKNALIVKLDI